MRIVAGEWRGRPLRAPKGAATRPTSDRVREALFSSLASMLGPDLERRAVLDAFGGTGALGLEALSRGASHAVFVESDRVARETLAANIAVLGAGARARVVAGDAFALAPRGPVAGGPFGLLLVDPPYRIDSACVTKLLVDLVSTGSVQRGAVVVCEHAADSEVSWPEGFDERVNKRYGSTGVRIAVYSQKDDSA